MSDKLTDAYRVILEALGADLQAPDLEDTPGRAGRAMLEMTKGMREPLPALSVFHEPTAEALVLVGPMQFWSLCEHHLLPFNGRAVVAYIPRGGQIIGLSKIPRVVSYCGQRLQNQERLASQIADTLNGVPGLDPLGVAVLVRSQHSCMAARGVRSDGSMVTSALRGVFKTEPAARAEFLGLAQGLL